MKTHLLTTIITLAALCAPASAITETEFCGLTTDSRESVARVADTTNAANKVASQIKDKATAEKHAVEYGVAMAKNVNAVAAMKKAVYQDAMTLSLLDNSPKEQDAIAEKLRLLVLSGMSGVNRKDIDRVKACNYYGSESLKKIAAVFAVMLDELEHAKE